jgi:hypothetical protein
MAPPRKYRAANPPGYRRLHDRYRGIAKRCRARTSLQAAQELAGGAALLFAKLKRSSNRRSAAAFSDIGSRLLLQKTDARDRGGHRERGCQPNDGRDVNTTLVGGDENGGDAGVWRGVRRREGRTSLIPGKR